MPGYLRFDPLKPEFKTCLYRDVEVHACGPIGYTGDPDALYRNNGDGTFTEVTEAAGVADKKRYYGFQAVFADFNNDGWPDLLVANDSNPNYLYRNKHDGTFEEVGVQAGIAYSADGKEMSSMGVATGDYDRDGLVDVFHHHIRQRQLCPVPQRWRRIVHRCVVRLGSRGGDGALSRLGHFLFRL